MPGLRLMLIVNPHASSVTPRRREHVEGRLRLGADVMVVDTTQRGDATALAASSLDAGVDAVLVLGGDGTLNEAAHGLVGTEMPLGCLPGGSTNVFARTIGVAYDQERAADQLVRALAQGATRRVGLGRVGSRHFLFHLGIGFDAAVVRTVERRPAVKRHLAHPAFAVAATTTWLRGYDRATRLEVEARDASGTPVRQGSGPFVVVSNSRPYTYVGRLPMTLAPQAGLDRGLALTQFCDLRFGRVVRAVATSLRRGERPRPVAGILQHEDLGALTVRGDRPFPYQVDGEYLGEVDRLDIVHEPGALTILVP